MKKYKFKYDYINDDREISRNGFIAILAIDLEEAVRESIKAVKKELKFIDSMYIEHSLRVYR